MLNPTEQKNFILWWTPTWCPPSFYWQSPSSKSSLYLTPPSPSFTAASAAAPTCCTRTTPCNHLLWTPHPHLADVPPFLMCLSYATFLYRSHIAEVPTKPGPKVQSNILQLRKTSKPSTTPSWLIQASQNCIGQTIYSTEHYPFTIGNKIPMGISARWKRLYFVHHFSSIIALKSFTCNISVTNLPS